MYLFYYYHCTTNILHFSHIIVPSALSHHYFESQNSFTYHDFSFQILDQITNISYHYRKNGLHVDLYDLYFGGTGIYINNYWISSKAIQWNLAQNARITRSNTSPTQIGCNTQTGQNSEWTKGCFFSESIMHFSNLTKNVPKPYRLLVYDQNQVSVLGNQTNVQSRYFFFSKEKLFFWRFLKICIFLMFSHFFGGYDFLKAWNFKNNQKIFNIGYQIWF